MVGLVIPENLRDKIINNMATITILAFIKEKENDTRGVSKDGVAKVMYEKAICSRPTTIKIMDSLLQAGILVERGRGAKNASDIVVSKDFDFDALMNESFEIHLKKLRKSIDPLLPFIHSDKIDKRKRRITVDLD